MAPTKRILLNMVAGLVLAVTTVAPADAATRPTSASKILLYGDSLTHGGNADWTWRYRLWQTLTKSKHAFDFVGPRTDLYEYTTHVFGSQGYRNPNFDRDHAAIAGMRLLNANFTPGQLSRTYQPNVVVAFIGLNDLYDTTVSDLQTEWRKQIAQARLYDRGVDFVIVPLPQTWWGYSGTGYNSVTAYNAMLSNLAASMNTPNERVLVAPLAALNRQTDTFDGLHLSASGELKIAAVVSKALVALGIGNGLPVTSTDPPDDHTWAPQPVATVGGTTISVSWPAVTYASSENVWVRDRTTGVVQVQREVPGETATISGEAGHSYDLWLEPVKGYLPIGTTSPTIQVDIPTG